MPLVFVQKSSTILNGIKTLSFIPYRGTVTTQAQDTARSMTIPSPFKQPPVTTSTEKPQSGSNSLKFLGSKGEAIYSTSSFTPFTFPGDFTIEMSFFPTILRSMYLFSFDSGSGVSYGSQSLYTSGDGRLGYQATATTTSSSIAPDLISSNAAFYQLNQWNHIAVTRAGNTYSVYINGIRVITTTNSAAPRAPSLRIMFGNAHTLSNGNFLDSDLALHGYLDNIRVTKGVARYTGATFTVPTFPFGTTVATDPNWNNVSMLLDMEASTNGLPYDQYHPSAFVASRAESTFPTLINGDSKSYYGSGAGTFNPYKTHFKIPNFNGAPGTEDFTWETRFYHYSKIAQYQMLISSRETDSSTVTGIGIGQNNGVLFVYTDKFLVQNGTLNTGAWNHIALVRKDGVFTLYLNGASVGSYSASVYNLTAQDVYVGANANGTQMNVSGYELMNDIRISQGARYTSNFTPPSVMTV